MRNMTMKELEKCFEQAKESNAKYVVVAIKTKGNEGLEYIINPEENFDNKLKYYKESYEENLILKTYDGIQIVNFAWGNTFAEIESILNFKMKA